MLSYQSSYLPSSDTVRDEVLQLVENCIISPEDSLLVLQDYLSMPAWEALELAHENRVGSIYKLSIDDFLNEETWALD